MDQQGNNMNNWSFTGNLGKDADVKYLPNGTAVCSFSVAVKSGFGDKEKTTWVKCGLFGKRAEGQLPQYLVKGAQVAITGEAFIDEWQNDSGAQKMLKVNVNNLDLIGGKQQQSQPHAPQQAPQQSPPRQAPMQPPQNQPMGSHQAAPQQAPQQAANFDDFDDDLLF